MNSFLKELALQLYNQYQSNLADVTLIFPNRRAGLFFRKNLAEVIETPVWAPHILSMEDFVHNFSDLQVADKLTLIFMLYDEYLKVNPMVESFDRFFSWGEIMLKDFDDIDKYLINPGHLFSSLREQKEMEGKFEYLTEEQKRVIRSFWSSFGDNISSQQEGFLKIWDLLPVIYKNFRQRLIENNIAYDGLIYREIALKCSDGITYNKHKKIVFAGFNSLSTSEEIIIKHFIKVHNAQIVWDVDKSYLENPDLEAGYYLRKYLKDKVFGPFFPDPLPNELNVGKEKDIEIIGVPLAVGQAKRLGEKLLSLIDDKKLQDLTQTVIVLPEENLLFPVLHSLPKSIRNINVTMGYPLKDTSLNSFIEHILNFQQQESVHNKGDVSFHHKAVLPLLKHPLFFQNNPELSLKAVAEIESRNIVYIPSASLKKQGSFFSHIFRKIRSTNELIDYLIEIVLIINKSIEVKKEEEFDDAQQENKEMFVSNSKKTQELEKEYVFQFYTLLNRLKSILTEQKIDINLSTFQKLFRQLVTTYKLPFSGEPLLGLQIMGALETRNLDFENVFILSMNEGAFPAKSSANSYIPFNLRKGFGLPTVDQQDANYAYTFYRLLQKAKRVFLFHNTEVGTNVNGEMSRYLYQLIYESNYNVSVTDLSNFIKPGINLPITIPKNSEVLEKLNKYILFDGLSLKRFTPSAINIYLDCRLKFYFRYIIGLHENDAVQDKVDSVVFGNILHLIMEKLYGDLICHKDDKTIYEKDFDLLHRRVDKALNQAFSSYFSKSSEEDYPFEGADIIASEIIYKYVDRILAYDKLYAPFEILGLEATEKEGYAYDLPVHVGSRDFTVGLKGVIDRIDLKNGVVRVIDYKSGVDKKDVESIASLFERENSKRNKAAFQTFFYGLLFIQKYPLTKYDIIPAIFNIKEMFGEDFDFRLKIKNENQKGTEPVNNVIPLLEPFTEGLQKIVAEIFDPAVPFDQTDDLKKCGYCPYSGICHRD